MAAFTYIQICISIFMHALKPEDLQEMKSNSLKKISIILIQRICTFAFDLNKSARDEQKLLMKMFPLFFFVVFRLVALSAF